MLKEKSIFIVWLLLTVAARCFETNLDNLDMTSVNTLTNRTLSRRKRHLIFPDGSSFQIVYCVTIPSLGIGSIFNMGLTASIAWELPSKPLYTYYKKNNDAAMRRHYIVKKPSANVIMNIENIQKQPQYIEYKVNPYLKQNQQNFYSKERFEYNRKPIQQSPVYYGPYYKNEYENYHRQPWYNTNNNNGYSQFYQHTVHHRSRRDLYSKIEKFFNTLSEDGKTCILKAICEISKRSKNELGSFTEEILKAVFTWRTDHNEQNNPIYNEYDRATTHFDDCNKIYSTCKLSVSNWI